MILYKNKCSVPMLLVFCSLYSRSVQLNFKWPESHIQLTPCHSTYTINSGNFVLDYNSKVTGDYNSIKLITKKKKKNIVKTVSLIIVLDDCTFLVESPPETRMQLNATITISKKSVDEECLGWIKLYDFHSNATLVPFGK